MRTKNPVTKTAIALAVSQAIFTSANGAVLVVDSLLDNITPVNGACTLREALNSVNNQILNADCSANVPGNNDQISFAPSISANDTIALSLGPLSINNDVTISGPTGLSLLTIDQQTANGRVLTIGPLGEEAPPTTSLSNLAITGGFSEFAGGGGMRISYGANVTLNNTVVTNNQAPNNFGGGIAVEFNSSLTLNSSAVTNNVANSYSGGIDVYMSTLTLNDSIIASNTAGQDGGGIRFNGSSATIKSSYFLSNTSSTGGGAISSRYSTVILTDNTQVRHSTTTGSGGGIQAQNSTIRLNSNSDIAYSSATLFGGGIASTNSVISISESTLAINSATINGGGLSAVGPNGSVNIDRSVMFANRSNNFGGGLYLANHRANIDNATILNNSALNRGGGIMLNNGGSVTLTNVTIAVNTAGLGGGISLYEGAGGTSASFSNSIVVANSADNGDEVAIEGTINLSTEGPNIFGANEITSAAAFFDFTPGLNDIVATSDGNDPHPALSIISVATNIGPSSSIAFPLPPGSPAIDAANASQCSDLDQRKVDRGISFPVPIKAANGNIAMVDLGGPCDIGAIAFNPLPPPPK